MSILKKDASNIRTAHSVSSQQNSVPVQEVKKRTAYDTCVYVHKPGEGGKKKMIVVNHGDTWEKFLSSVSAKLDIEARRYC
jgi:hypothetical protein